MSDVVHFTWQNSSMLPPVQDQGTCCESCWAIASNASVSSRLAIYRRLPPTLFSSQQLCDDCYYLEYGFERVPFPRSVTSGADIPLDLIAAICTSLAPPGQCCAANYAQNAFIYMTLFGVNELVEYPVHSARVRSGCRQHVGGYLSLAGSSPEEINFILEHDGPIVATFAVYSRFYQLGPTDIYDATTYVEGDIFLGNHDIILVGWGERAGVEYFIYQNSHGEDFGVQGFGLVSRNSVFRLLIPLRPSVMFGVPLVPHLFSGLPVDRWYWSQFFLPRRGYFASPSGVQKRGSMGSLNVITGKDSDHPGKTSGAPANGEQEAYAVISVQLKDQRLEFEQFLLSGSLDDGQWIVPITLSCSSYDARKSFLLQTKSEALDIKDLLGVSDSKDGSWIKINVDQAGFYRVKYDDELSRRLRTAIESKQLSTMDRYGILDDWFALSMECQQSLTSLLALMSAFREEPEYTVLSYLISISFKVARIAADAVPELMDGIKLFFINLFQNSAERLGWAPKQGESHLDAMLRGELLTALATFGHEPTISEANRRFQIFLDDRNASILPPDLRLAAYVAVMQNVSKSNRSGYDSLLRVYRETDLSQEKTRILVSLPSCRDPEIILEILNFLLSSEVRSQDVVFGLALSTEGRETAWQWLKDNWDHLTKTCSVFLITWFIVSPLSSDDKAREVQEFFASRMNPYIARTLKQSIERVHINTKWVYSIKDEKSLSDAVMELGCR